MNDYIKIWIEVNTSLISTSWKHYQFHCYFYPRITLSLTTYKHCSPEAEAALSYDIEVLHQNWDFDDEVRRRTNDLDDAQYQRRPEVVFRITYCRHGSGQLT